MGLLRCKNSALIGRAIAVEGQTFVVPDDGLLQVSTKSAAMRLLLDPRSWEVVRSVKAPAQAPAVPSPKPPPPPAAPPSKAKLTPIVEVVVASEPKPEPEAKLSDPPVAQPTKRGFASRKKE